MRSANYRLFQSILVLGVLFGLVLGFNAPTLEEAHVPTEEILDSVEETQARGTFTPVQNVTGYDLEALGTVPDVEVPGANIASGFYMSLVYGMLELVFLVANVVAPLGFFLSKYVPPVVLDTAIITAIVAYGTLTVRRAVNGPEG